MSDRLDKLREQKRLIEQHLNWLNQEIESESGTAPAPTPTPVQASQPVSPAPEPEQPTVQAVTPQPSEDDANLDQISEDLISQYAGESDRREMNPKVGCILYFVGAFAFIAAVIYAIYWFGYR